MAGVPLVLLLDFAPVAVNNRSLDCVSQFHLAMLGVPVLADAFQSWSTISRSRSPSHQARKLAAGMLFAINCPLADRSSPTGEFQAASPPMAQPSAPVKRGSMSPAAARPVSLVAGMLHSTSPVRASRKVAPLLPLEPISSWAANVSSPGRDGSRSQGWI